MKTTIYEKLTLRAFVCLGFVASYSYLVFAVIITIKAGLAGVVHLGCALAAASLVHLIWSVAKAVFEIRDALPANKSAQP